MKSEARWSSEQEKTRVASSAYTASRHARKKSLFTLFSLPWLQMTTEGWFRSRRTMPVTRASALSRKRGSTSGLRANDPFVP